MLLSDATLCANCGGISQTLYNIFSFADPKNILCVSSDKEFKAFAPSERFLSRYITYKFEIIEPPKNRLGQLITPFAEWFNYSFNNIFGRYAKIKSEIKAFDPDVIIACPNGPVGVFMPFKLLEGINIKKVIPYFMDDWMFQTKLKWIGGNIQNKVKALLTANPSWIMISKELSKILEQRYDVIPRRLLELHNPVDLSNAPHVLPFVKKDTYTLAYAGALWPMHYDSFKIVAQGVKQLRAKRNVKLILYSPAGFWVNYKDELELLDVSYGGNIPYSQIHEKLARADALILVSSFLREFYSHSKGSLQTKMTDYLKAKRLIISCGPEYSANHNFIKKHQCGVCIETNDVDEVAAQLHEILNNIEANQQLVSNGWDVLINEFTFEKVHKKLKDFIAESVENVTVS